MRLDEEMLHEVLGNGQRAAFSERDDGRMRHLAVPELSGRRWPARVWLDFLTDFREHFLAQKLEWRLRHAVEPHSQPVYPNLQIVLRSRPKLDWRSPNL